MNIIEKSGAKLKNRVKYALKLKACVEKMKKETFSSIHFCSIFIWYKIRETGDLTWLLKEKKRLEADKYYANWLHKLLASIKLCRPFYYTVDMKNRSLMTIYSLMNDEFIEDNGWTEQEIKVWQTKLKIIELREKIRDGDDAQWTWLAIEKERLKLLTNQNTGERQGLFDLTAILEDSLKLNIDVYSCSVPKFYALVNRVKEKAEQYEMQE